MAPEELTLQASFHFKMIREKYLLSSGKVAWSAVNLKEFILHVTGDVTAVQKTGVILSDGTNTIDLNMNSNGDLIVTQSAGPNAGKSINLTYGRWS